MSETGSESVELEDYDFELPADRIAQVPSPRREQARLMQIDRKTGAVVEDERHVSDLPRLLRPGDLLVLNATRVLAARLRGRKSTGGGAEALLLGPAGNPDDRRYRALVRISGRLRVGLRFVFGPADRELSAEIEALYPGGEALLVFEPGPSPYSLGEAPLPPYIRRTGDGEEQSLRAEDLERYQTVYARVPGAVAAPTAGLHLTRELLAELDCAGIERSEVVLHVGPGTFRPIRPDDLAAGRLHSEPYELPEETVEAIARARSRGGRVVAVGTTTTRVLESCARPDGSLRPGSGETDLFLRPGSRFRVVDALLTNFHLPRSSLLLLVAAFVGREAILSAYRRAVESGYRFYSYGDAMLIIS